MNRRDRRLIRGWTPNRWHVWVVPPWRWFVEFNRPMEYWTRTVIGPFYILRTGGLSGKLEKAANDDERTA